MATNLKLDDEITALTGTAATGTAWHTRLAALLRAAFHSSVNPFGSAAKRATGTTAGSVPVLGAGGRLPAGMIPILPPSRISGTLATPGTLALAAAGSTATDQMPRIPASKFTSGIIDFRNVPPFPASRILGRLALARLPALPASGTTGLPFATIRSRTYFTLRGNQLRGAVGSGPGIARIDSRTASITISGSRLDVLLTVLGTYRAGGRDR